MGQRSSLDSRRTKGAITEFKQPVFLQLQGCGYLGAKQLNSAEQKIVPWGSCCALGFESSALPAKPISLFHCSFVGWLLCQAQERGSKNEEARRGVAQPRAARSSLTARTISSPISSLEFRRASRFTRAAPSGPCPNTFSNACIQ